MLEQDERIVDISPAPWVVELLIGVTAFVGGIGLGYFLGRKRKKGSPHDDPSNQDWSGLTAAQLMDISVITADLAHMRAKREEASSEREVSKVERVVIEETAYLAPHEIEEDDEGVITGVFDADTHEELDLEEYMAEKASRNGSEGFNQDERAQRLAATGFEHELAEDPVAQGWDYETEIASRSPDKPCVLHRDEFAENQLGLNQFDYTFYEGDSTMVDDIEDEIIPNWKQFIPNPIPWGKGSGDDMVVYIRNEQRRAEYAISRDDRSFASVNGLYEEQGDVDLRHSSGPKKFRMEE